LKAELKGGHMSFDQYNRPFHSNINGASSGVLTPPGLSVRLQSMVIKNIGGGPTWIVVFAGYNLICYLEDGETAEFYAGESEVGLAGDGIQFVSTNDPDTLIENTIDVLIYGQYFPVS